MTNNKNAPPVEKPHTEHSAPFYISHSLFENKRLKQKRLRWQEAIGGDTADNIANRRSKKAERRQRNSIQRKRRLLQFDVIDLLSDDDNVNALHHGGSLLPAMLPPEQKECAAAATAATLQHFFVYQEPTGAPEMPHITLVPMSMQQHNTYIRGTQKSWPPNRLPEPTIVNDECIVLTDDDDDNNDAADNANVNGDTAEDDNDDDGESNNNISFAITKNANKLRSSTPIADAHTSLASTAANVDGANTLQTALLDEEVTVSLVPRSSTAGNCSTVKPKALIPAEVSTERDETTVHTTIANRRYMFTLTKLREGLASGTVANFNNSSSSNNKNKNKNKNNGQQPKKAVGQVWRPATTPPPAPISLKLSSELSISLISDEDEDNDANAEDAAAQEQLSAQKLLQRQPHLSVQQVQLPVAATQPRRQKLGWR